MKKLSLLFVFVMIFVMLFAFSVSAKNITKEAEFSMANGGDLCQPEYVIDDNYHTAASNGNASDYVDYYFEYETGRTITKIRVIYNSIGENMGVCTYDEISTYGNNIICRVKPDGGTQIQLESKDATVVYANGKAIYSYIDFVPAEGTTWENITWINIPTIHSKDEKTCIWEIDIFDDQACTDDTHEFQCNNCDSKLVCNACDLEKEETSHPYLAATCAAPQTCVLCDVTTGDKSSEHTGTWLEATCITPSTCSVCGATQGEVSTEHAWVDATCAAPKTCSVCGKTEGEATTDHIWMNASYTAPATCKICKLTKGEPWVDSTLTNFVRGDEGDTVTYEDIIGEVELIAGSTGNGDPSYVLDNITGVVGNLWGGPTDSAIKITLKNEWEITEVKAILATNWCQIEFAFYAADGTKLGSHNPGWLSGDNIYFLDQVNYSYPETLTYTDFSKAVSGLTYGDDDKAVKYIVITDKGGSWSWTPAVLEAYFIGRERIPTACENHEFEEKILAKPTCTEVGYKQNVCTVCGVAEGVVTIPALGHSYDEYTIKTPATCITAPVFKFKCVRCSETIERDANVKDVTDYIDLESVETKGAGAWTHKHYSMFNNNMDSYLMASGEWYVQSETALDMNYYISSVTVWVGNGRYDTASTNSAWMIFYYKAPGSDEWVEAGKMATPATYANTKYEYTLELAEPVYASAIKIYVGDQDGKPQGGGPGLESYNGVVYEAEVAGSLIKETAAGHTWVAGETVAPKCYDFGYTNYTCSVCGATKKDDIVRETGHSWVNATCTTPKTCSACSETSGEALGHDMTVAATCTTPLSCSRCDYTEGEALGHTWVDATCTAPKTCSVCSATEGEALGHTYGWNIGTKVVDGVEVQMHGCSVCKTEAVLDTEGGNVSTNLGIRIYYASSLNDFKNNFNSTNYDVIRLTTDIAYNSNLAINNENIIIDFGGHSYTKTGGRFDLQNVKSLVNGTIYQNHGLYAIRVYCAGSIEDFNVIVGATYNDNATGIYMSYNANYGGSKLGYMKNVTIDSVRDENGNYKEGIGLFNHGIEFSNVNSEIGDLENVKVYSRGQAMTLSAKSIGTMTNCVFSGDNVALALTNLQCGINLVNCVVSSDVLAIYIEKAATPTEENPIFFNFDADTTISSNGTAFYILPTGDGYDFSTLTSAVALVNGQLYSSFEAALAALAASTEELTTFTLIGDLTLDAPIEISKAVQFSIGGGKFKVPIIGTKKFNEYDAPGYVLTAPNGAFVVTENGALTIVGDKGTVVGNENAIVVEDGGEALIVAGTYVGYNPQNYVSSDSCVANNDGTYTLTKNHTYDNHLLYGVLYRADGDCNVCGYVRGVARVGEDYYATIEEAIAAAVAINAANEAANIEDRVSVELATNVDLPASLVISDVVTIILNGKTISTSKDTAGDGVFHVVAGGELTITDYVQYFVGTVNGVCASEYNMAIWADGGKVIIEAGIFTNVGAGDADQYDLIYVKNGGIVEIKGGTFLAQTPKWTLNSHDKFPGTFVVTGGTFQEGFNPGATETEPAGANNDFIPVGYYLNDNIVMVCPHAEYASVVTAPTCTDKGYTTYTCECGDTYTADEVPATGIHTYDLAGATVTETGLEIPCSYNCGKKATINSNTQLQVQTNMFTGEAYVMVATPGYAKVTISANESAFYKFGASPMMMGKMPFGTGETSAIINADPLDSYDAYTLMVMFDGESTVDPVITINYEALEAQKLVVGENTIDTTNVPVKAEFSVPGTYKISFVGDMISVCNEYGADYMYEEFELTVAEGQTVVMLIYAESVTIANAHTHTEEIIPAVLPLPSNGHKGSTAGVKCLECGEILVAPVEITAKANDNASFKINTAALALSDGITLIYKATLPAGYEDAYIVFEYRGEEEVVSTKVYSEEEGRYHFRFSKVTPQYMGENITATMYANVNGEYVLAYKSIDYSVRAYCVSQLSKNIDDKLRTLISDFLVYGANAQIATGKDEVLVTEGLTLSPSTFEKLDATQNVKGVSGTKASEADWSTATLSLGSSVNMLFKFYAEDLEGLQIKITIKDREQTINAIDCVDTAEAYNNKTRYTATFTNITAIEFGETVTAVFLKDGVQIGRTVMYSVNSYIYENQDKVTGSLLDLLKALYNYGKAAYNSVN